ncbi:MAG: metallophosphoesterase [Pseudomonadota bacterium]
MRLFTVSDLHIDHTENLAWLKQLSRSDYTDDVLILAGDIADDHTLLRWSLHYLAECFKKVLFVPGNHDLWTLRSRREASFDKFAAIEAMCREADIGMQPYRLGATLIVPLLGWYDESFGIPGPALRAAWMDFRACNWEGRADNEVSRLFDAMNPWPDTTGAARVLTFSHFLPRIDLMPAAMPSKYHYLYPVFGSQRLERRLRALGSSMHIYGHSHLNRRVDIDGVTYINNAFAYPTETRIAAKALLQLDYA